MTSLSDELERCLDDEDALTLGRLVDALDERSFALVVALLLFPSALPVPTGGLTHVFEVAALLVVVQMVVGRQELWLPKFVARRELGKTFTDKTIPAIVRRIRWFEQFARPRLVRLVDTRASVSLLGVVLFVFIAAAFVAPPFSGLDTLPSLGVVLVCLGLLFSDGAIIGVGLVIGTAGIVLVVFVGSVILHFL